MNLKFHRKSVIHPRFISDAVEAIRGVIGESCNSDNCDYSSSKHKATIKDGVVTLAASTNTGLTSAHLAQSNANKNEASGGNPFNSSKSKPIDSSPDISKMPDNNMFKPTQTSTSKDVKQDSDGFEHIDKLPADAKRTFDSKLQIVDIKYTIVDNADKLTKAEDSDLDTIGKETKEEEPDKGKDTKSVDIGDDIKDQFLDSGITGFSL